MNGVRRKPIIKSSGGLDLSTERNIKANPNKPHKDSDATMTKKNDKKKNDGKMVSHNIAEEDETTTTEEKSNNLDNSKNKRKRLSKKERKALKKQKKKEKRCQEEQQQDQGINEKHHEEEQKEEENQHNQPRDVNGSKLSEKEIDDKNNRADDDDEDEDESWMMESYKSIPVPLKPSKEVINSCNSKSKQQHQKNDDIDEGGGGGGSNSKTTLGKWFPNALLMKCPLNYSNTGKLLLLNNSNNDDESSRVLLSESDVKVDNPKASLVLFYQYTPKKWSSAQLQLLMTYLQQIVRSRKHIGGRIRIAQEGVNATISSVDYPEYTSKEILRHFAEDLRQFDPITFGQTDFKYIDNLPPDRHFKELKIIPVQELVFYDIASTEAPLDLEQQGGTSSKKEEDDTTLENTAATKVDGIRGGIHLDAKQYHEMLKKDNTVVIDVRNHYETIIGRFDGQQQQQNQEMSSSTVVVSASSSSKKSKKQGESEASSSATTAAEVVAKKEPEESTTTTTTTGENRNGNGSAGGAEYLDPLMRKSTDFKSWLANDETKSKLHNKTVLMYCTGGIRCERASAYLKKEMGNHVDGVYQLQGGIERYLKAFPDGGFWRGKNFVFDKREAVSIDNPDGDGGVIRKKKAKKNKSNNDNDDKELPSSKCVVCGVSWDRYVGKKKCYTCGVPVLMCDKCMSLKPDKKPGMQLKVRCPLCVEEDITKPACEVDWTANGMKTTTSTTTTSSNSSKPVATAAAATAAKAANATTNKKKKGGDENRASSNAKKAAGSVLKWGGGHASNKKLGRKVKGRMCRFGVDCARKDCIFVHPPGWK